MRLVKPAKAVAGILYGTVAIGSVLSSSSAEEFNAGAVINKMSDRERHSYMAGVIEGLAYSRYRHDNKGSPASKDAAGMNCIYEWWYRREGTQLKVLKAFVAFPTQYPGAIVASFARKECGEW